MNLIIKTSFSSKSTTTLGPRGHPHVTSALHLCFQEPLYLETQTVRSPNLRGRWTFFFLVNSITTLKFRIVRSQLSLSDHLINSCDYDHWTRLSFLSYLPIHLLEYLGFLFDFYKRRFSYLWSYRRHSEKSCGKISSESNRNPLKWISSCKGRFFSWSKRIKLRTRGTDHFPSVGTDYTSYVCYPLFLDVVHLTHDNDLLLP